MGILVRDQRIWTQQQRGLPRVDWSNPLTRGLVRLVVFHLGKPFDLVTQTFLTQVSTGFKAAPTTSGLGLANTNETSYWTMPLRTDILTNNFSMGWVGSTQGGTSTIVARDASNSGGTIPIWQNSGFDVRLGSVDFTPPAPAFTTGVLYNYIMSSTPSAARIAVNGRVYTLSGTPGGINNNNPWYIHQNGTAGQGALHTSVIIPVWDRGVDAIEQILFSQNPFQLFEPEEEYVHVTSGGAYTPAIAEAGAAVDAQSVAVVGQGTVTEAGSAVEAISVVKAGGPPAAFAVQQVRPSYRHNPMTGARPAFSYTPANGNVDTVLGNILPGAPTLLPLTTLNDRVAWRNVSGNAGAVSQSQTRMVSADWTVVVYAAPVSSASPKIAYSNTVAIANTGFSLCFNGYGLLAAAGTLMLVARGGLANINAVSVVDGRPHVFAARALSGNYSLWVDGVQVASGSSLGALTLVGNSDYVGGDVDGTSGQMVDPLAYVQGYNSALPDAVMAEYRRDPFLGFLIEEDGIYVPLPSDGTGTVAESGAATDAQSVAMAAAVAIAEAGTAADDQSVVKAIASSIAEAGSAVDAQDVVKAMASSIAESGSGADAQDVVKSITAAINESGSAADAQTVLAALSGVVTEAGSATDVQTAQAALSAAIAESGTATDAQSATVTGDYNAALAEAGNAVDAADAVVARAAALSEAASATDSQSVVQDISASISEAGSAVDAQNATAQLVGTVAEAGSATDSQDAVTARSGTVTESGAAVDSTSATASGDYTGTVNEAGNAVDSQTAQAALSQSIAEAGSAVDSQSAVTAGDYAAALAEAGNAVDAQSAMVSKFASVTETGDAQAVQSATATGDYTGTITEQADAQDVSTVVLSITRTVLESATAADAQDAVLATPGQYVVSVIEAATATDSQDVTRGLYASLTEAANAADAVLINWSYLASITEAAGATDWSSAVLTLVGIRDYTGDFSHVSRPTVMFHVSRRQDISHVSRDDQMSHISRPTDVSSLH